VRLLLVRHGETEYNRLGLALGRGDVPLNVNGRRQARRLARALATEGVSAIYSSPLRRCLDTAAAIARACGLQVQVLPELVEMDIGRAEGLTYAEVRERFPDVLQRWLSSQDPSLEALGGESLPEVQERAWSAIVRLAQAHRGQTIVVVTHNFVILAVLARALGMPLASFRRLRHSVAAISELELEGESVALRRLNDTCHLRRADGRGWLP
jgi:broad specificity phosphatase PhoE